MALVELQDKGHLKYVVSQNCDGLHRLSGIHPHNLSDVHGNVHVERCDKCGQEQLFDNRVRNRTLKGHLTGRKCFNAGCKGDFNDTGVAFGEYCNPDVFALAEMSHDQADLCLAMGTSMRLGHVTPMPIGVARRGGNLVMVNLQKTPIDHEATLVIHGKTDDVMRLTMENLKY